MDPAALAAIPAIAIAAPAIALKCIRALQQRRRLKTIEGLSELPPSEFERTVGSWLSPCGWRVEHRGGTGDGGIDLVAFRRDLLLAIQCKRYRPDRAVPASHIRDLYGAATALGATTAFLVTTGRVSRPALQWIAELPDGPTQLAVIDGDLLSRIARSRRWDPRAHAT